VLPKFVSQVVERFGHPIGVECECISGEELTLLDRAIPILEKSQHCARGVEAFQSVIAAEEKGGVMPTIGVA
jgi:hypothetical protein